MRSKSDLEKEMQKVNEILKAEAIALHLGTRMSRSRMDQARAESSNFSYWAEMEFREYVRRQLEKYSSVASANLINGGARLLSLSPETTKRYLRKMRSDGGPFAGLGDIVTLNARYVPPEDDEYWGEEEEPHPQPLPKRVRMERGEKKAVQDE